MIRSDDYDLGFEPNGEELKQEGSRWAAGVDYKSWGSFAAQFEEHRTVQGHAVQIHRYRL